MEYAANRIDYFIELYILEISADIFHQINHDIERNTLYEKIPIAHTRHILTYDEHIALHLFPPHNLIGLNDSGTRIALMKVRFFLPNNACGGGGIWLL